MEGVGHVLRRHKVIDDLDAAVEVLDLSGGTRTGVRTRLLAGSDTVRLDAAALPGTWLLLG